jgi:hypothetical protein
MGIILKQIVIIKINRRNYNMKKYILCLLAIISFSRFSHAQNEIHKHKVAIFVPLYLDSAFDNTNKYKFAKNTFPKFLNPGLEFYEGVQLALDSISKKNIPVEVFVYDSKSTKETISQQLKKPELDSTELIIAHCSASDVRIFADAGLKRNIPVINVNLPNDGGVTANPFFVLLNSTLKTQCEGIYKHLQKYYSLNPIIIFTKKGQMEDRIKTYFTDLGKLTWAVPIKFKFVNLTDSIGLHQLKPHLDTTNETICVTASLDENFGKRLTQQLATLKKQNYQATVLGMPTWDNIKDFNKPEYKGIDIIYSTPFNNERGHKLSQEIISSFNKQMYARPTDMVFRGYEVTLKFLILLATHGNLLANSFSNKLGKVFTDFDVQPVINKQSKAIDYYENKKLYFLKWQDGSLKAVY